MVGTAIFCSFNLPPTNPNSTAFPSGTRTTTLITQPKTEENWKRKYSVLGLTIMIGNLTPINYADHETAVALVMVKEREDSGRVYIKKWSNQRMCQPWRLNSLETVVPENLPRQSAHRKWESVVYAGDAPAVKAVRVNPVSGRNDCFKM